jgi:PTS system nitrogen regulatory IIA component
LDKQQLLRELAAHAANKVGIPESQIESALMKREALGSTGMGNGVAIPHARFQQLRRPFGLFAGLKRPIEFDAIDGTRVDIVFALLLPEQSDGGPLSVLAAVARKLRSPDMLKTLRKSRGKTELYRALVGERAAE